MVSIGRQRAVQDGGLRRGSARVHRASAGHRNAPNANMADTILTPCLVPWTISPSSSGITLSHTETDTQPECTVVFGAGRLMANGLTDFRRVEIAFEQCYYVRLGPHDDNVGIEAIGYTVDPPLPNSRAEFDDGKRRWRETGHCPWPDFYVATRSAWLEELPEHFRRHSRHYVVDGRDGYVELIAERFRWREWLWTGGLRELAPTKGPPVAEGEGIA